MPGLGDITKVLYRLVFCRRLCYGYCMTTSTPFQTALSDAPKMYATAVSHLEHAERLLLDGNQAMADVIARGSGMANPSAPVRDRSGPHRHGPRHLRNSWLMA